MRYILLLVMVVSLSGCCSCVPPGPPPNEGEHILPPVIEVTKLFTPEQAVDHAFAEFFDAWLLANQDPKPVISSGMPDIDGKTFFEYQLAARFVSRLQLEGWIVTGDGVNALALRATQSNYRLKDSDDYHSLVRFTLTSPTGDQLWKSSDYPLKP